ncbi:MAG: ATP-binding protein [Erysipelotrichaceae bacterium]|nr:ATP-binding protein [Erysipelotrichaceae bacterium]
MKDISTGTENFKEIIDYHYYYVDKTMLIKDISNEKFALYTRPRRFGKTLNMSMLYYFYSIKEKDNAYLFNGLEISKDKDIMKHQNQYPVIFITLKDMKRETYELQIDKFGAIIKDTVLKYPELFDSPYLDESEKIKLNNYKFEKASMNDLMDALKNLTSYLYKHYSKKVFVLIDEYDVPLSDAYNYGYFDKMAKFISTVFSAALKTNDYLEKGVFTGCLRIAKESIFTDLNNFNVYSINEIKSSTRFGFTYNEIQELCHYYNVSDKIDVIKEWYDGYLFGDLEIYKPWSVLNYINRVLMGKTKPKSFWFNTGSNYIIKEYIEKADNQLHEEFELLIKGGCLTKKINPELTYREMDQISNIYSFLLFTGYLKIHKIIDESLDIYELTIPNREVKEIYINTFNEWFKEYTDSKKYDLKNALNDGNDKKAMDLLNDILESSISYYDNYEAFYHGFIIGLFSEYKIESNRESGDGRFDIAILPKRASDITIVIECKYSETFAKLIPDSIDAMQQIIDEKYIEGLNIRGYHYVVGYGISFYKKTCYVTKLGS